MTFASQLKGSCGDEAGSALRRAAIGLFYFSFFVQVGDGHPFAALFVAAFFIGRYVR